MQINRIIFSDEAEKIYLFLKEKAKISKKERMIFDAINYKIEIIKNNCYYGNNITKNLIPIEYKIKYNTETLFRIELPCFWRMLYTIRRPEKEVEIIGFVLDILDHNNYNRLFGYKKK